MINPIKVFGRYCRKYYLQKLTKWNRKAYIFLFVLLLAFGMAVNEQIRLHRIAIGRAKGLKPSFEKGQEFSTIDSILLPSKN